VLPDYGELLTRKFTDRVRGEVPGWPETILKEIPVHGHFESQGHNLMEFKITEIGVSSLRGFIMKANVEIKKSAGVKVYSRHIYYRGASLDRKHTLDAYFANDCKILMEEFSFSTDYSHRIDQKSQEPTRRSLSQIICHSVFGVNGAEISISNRQQTNLNHKKYGILT
jgi:hypothetical protein